MKKKIYVSIAALALLFGGGVMTSNALGIVPTGSEDPEPVYDITPTGGDVKGDILIDTSNETVSVKLTCTLPVEGYNSDWEYVDLPKLDKVILKRMKNWSEATELITWEKPTPGEVKEFTDNSADLELGKEYQYFLESHLGDKSSTSTYAYVTVGIVPVTPDAPTVEVADDFLSATVKYVCPDAVTGSYWEEKKPFPEGVTYTAIELYTAEGSEYYGNYTETILDSHANPTPGQEFTFVHQNPPMGTVKYYLRTRTAYGVSDYTIGTAFVGYDYPGPPSNVTAGLNEDGDVKVTWGEPIAYNGGTLDIETVKYKVYRNTMSYVNDSAVLLAEDITGREFVDALENVESEQRFYYMVYAYNEYTPADYTYNYSYTQRPIIAGPAAPLPYVENFNTGSKWNKNYDNLWDADFAWDTFDMYYIRYNDTSVKVSPTETLNLTAGVDGGTDDDEEGRDGFFFVSHSNWYQNLNPGYLSSGHVNFAEAENPAMTLWYVPVNNNSGTVYVEFNMGEYDEDNQPVWYTINELSCDDPDMEDGDDNVTTELKWKKAVLPLEDLAGLDKVQLRLKYEWADVDHAYPMAVDKIGLDDYPAVSELRAEKLDDGSIRLDWDLPASAGEKAVKYNVYNGEDKLATVTEKEYIIPADEVITDKDYLFSVEAAYDDLTAPACEPVSFYVSGVVDINAENVASVEYYDLSGVRVINPAKDAQVVAVVKYNDGTKKAVKMIVK